MSSIGSTFLSTFARSQPIAWCLYLHSSIFSPTEVSLSNFVKVSNYVWNKFIDIDLLFSAYFHTTEYYLSYLSSKYLNIYYVIGTLLGTRNTVVK